MKAALKQYLETHGVYNKRQIRESRLDPALLGQRRPWTKREKALILKFGHKWTVQELETFSLPLLWNKAWLKGQTKTKTYREIADELGLDEGTVAGWVKRHKLSSPGRGREILSTRMAEIEATFERTGNIAATAELLDISYATVARALPSTATKGSTRTMVAAKLEAHLLEGASEASARERRSRDDWLNAALRELLADPEAVAALPQKALNAPTPRRASSVMLDDDLKALLERDGINRNAALELAARRRLESKVKVRAKGKKR